MIRSIWGLLFLVGLAVLVYCLATGRLWIAGACFMVLGVFYALLEQTQHRVKLMPVMFKDGKYSFFHLFFSWPVRLYWRMIESVRYATADDRYVVTGNSLSSPKGEFFRSKSEAFAHAKKVANATGMKATVGDTYIEEYNAILGSMSFKMTTVEPDPQSEKR